PLSKEQPDLKTSEALPQDKRREMKLRMSDLGITMPNYYAPLEGDKGAYRKIFDFAKEMGVETLVAEPPPETFEALDGLCQEYKINLAVHNHPEGSGSKYWNPDAFVKACEGRSARIGGCPDSGHWVRSGLDNEMYGFVSQLLQAEGMRIAIEAQRKAKPACMGTLYWQLNDCWPVVSWSSRDYYGRKKAFYYESRRLFDSIMIITATENEKVSVYISSDARFSQKATLHIRLTGFSGEIFKDEILPVVIDPNSSRIYYSIPKSELLKNMDPATMVFSASFRGPEEFRNKSLLFFTSPKDLKLPAAVISKKIKRTHDGYEIRLTSNKLVKNAWLLSSVNGDFSDNYFDLLPGEVCKITFSTRAKNMNLDNLIKISSLVDSY
ncbi:MAG: glycoside hydrolase family 2 protein, partial [Bacteroidota bacterium]